MFLSIWILKIPPPHPDAFLKQRESENLNIDRVGLSIISATLEHTEDWKSALENIVSAAPDLILLRSFFGEIQETSYYKKSNAKSRYLIRQFAFEDISIELEKYGFNVKFIRDHATDSIPQYLGCSIVRTQYIALARKINP